jgi:putative protein-disulfide isomerase
VAQEDGVEQAVLYYAHDPMCSWCWGFSPVLRNLTAGLPEHVAFRRLLGGLAQDTEAPMPAEMQQRIQATWRRIRETIPAAEFNFDFWTHCNPRRSTWASCRAVIAARCQGARYDKQMTTAIQHAYYLQARNPSDKTTLIELAGELGLNVELFIEALDSPATQQELGLEMQQCATLRASSFPALVLQDGTSQWHIPIDYHDAGSMLTLLDELLAPA